MVPQESFHKVEPRRPFGGVFNRTGSLEGPPLTQPGRYPRTGVMNPGLGSESVRPRSESRGLHRAVVDPFQGEAVRLPDRTRRGRAE